MEDLAKELGRHFSLHVLAGVIRDSFSHQEIIKIMASHGAVFCGTRMESVGRGELADYFAEDALQIPKAREALVLNLDRTHRKEIEEIRLLPLGEIKKMLLLVPEICREDKIGKIVWTLFRDGRGEVRQLISSFLEAVSRHLAKEHEEFEMRADFRERFKQGKLKKGEVKALGEILASLSKEREASQEKLQRVEKELVGASQARDQLKEELKIRRRREEELMGAAGKLKRELGERDERIRFLEASLEKFSKDEIERLRHDFHFLERENRKITHERETLQSETARLRTELEAKQTLSFHLARELEEASQERLVLERRLEELSKKEQGKAVPAPLKPEPVVSLKAKGKRLGIFIDMQNILIAARRLQRRIDFDRLLEFLILDRHLVKAVAYVVEMPELDQEAFFQMLRRKGIEVRTRTLIRRSDGSAKGNWDTGIVVDAIDRVEKKDLDIVLVVSGDGDFIDLFKFLKARGIQVEAAGFPFSTAHNLPSSVDQFFPLNDSILKPAETSAILR